MKIEQPEAGDRYCHHKAGSSESIVHGTACIYIYILCTYVFLSIENLIKLRRGAKANLNFAFLVEEEFIRFEMEDYLIAY